MVFLFNLLHSQLLVTVPKPTTPFTDQTVIVTGANTGLGFEAAKHIVSLSARKVILACRSLERGEAAKRAIEESTKRTDVVEVWELDLSSYGSVKAFATRATGLERLDVLLENAGIATQEFRMAEDNEATITVNVVSTFLLGLLLLPKMRETKENFGVTPRLTVVTSALHFRAKFEERKRQGIFGALNDKKTAKMADRYNTSKLLEILIVRHLTSFSGFKTGETSAVVINTVNPGFCHSELTREASGFPINVAKAIMARTTEEGSRDLVIAASAGKESHGEYVSDGHVAGVSQFVASEKGAAAGQRVWEELSQKLEAIQPNILHNL
ncbi:hypothetical protein MMC08_000540 [Hypocenomyce scalaris]|nr:hypothetical protein [Hypocenomyce scalaris]